MITAIVCGVLLIAMYCAGSNGEWGSVVVGAVIVLLLIGLSCSWSKTSRAYGNFVDYWAEGGPDKKK